ncbi:UNVERIFIED_CONTAM: hypothetical protein Cloal_0205 [Acetivibrio alkalicellulosi]
MAIIEFINASNKTYKGMKRAIDYIQNPDKTLPNLIKGKNCSPNTVYNEFVITKQNFKKEIGRQFIHFTQSFSPKDKVTPDMIIKIADKLLEHECFKDFQVVYATHIDKEHLHTHFIINSVSFNTGKKWQLSKENLANLKEYSDELCREYGLIIVDGIKDNRKNRGEYRSKEKNQSFKYELFLAVKKCKWLSVSKEDFIDNMQKLGYKVDWRDDRKYITFTTPEGKKCRNNKLYPKEQFTKESLLGAFELNRQQTSQNELHQKMELLLFAVQLLSKREHNLNHIRFPLTTLEGQAKKERALEESKGRGLDWDRGNGHEI